MANVKELREKIAARKAQRAADQKAKYAKMVLVAQKAPEKLEACLAGLAEKCAGMAEGWDNLRENLGLVKASKEAPLKVRLAAARNYAKNFVRIAEESPDKLAEALIEAYQGLNDIAADIELAADQMGVELEAAPEMESAVIEMDAPASFEGEEQDIAQDIIEEAEAEGESPAHELEEKAEGDHDEEEEKEASGSDAFVTDRDEAGQPKPVEGVDVPRVAAGSDNWVSDRDESGSPKAPAKMEIPQAQGAAPQKSARKKKADGEYAEAFVKDIPQSQGTTEVGKKAEMLQEVGGGHEAQPAEKFVKEIPQSQGQSEINKAAAQLKHLVKKAMSRKDYIVLADAIRSFKMQNSQREELAKHFAQYLKRDNSRFSEGIFVDYAMGRGGSRGGNKFKGDEPNATPEALFV